MIQSGELPTDTMAEAKELEREWRKNHPDEPLPFTTSIDIKESLEKDIFPCHASSIAYSQSDRTQ